MSDAPDDEQVLSRDPVARHTRMYQWVLDHLAKFPGRVTAVTFVAGAAVAAIVVLADGDDSPTTVISLVATLWALFFAVMIYLLTARDNDKVLDQIADLQEQLATALAPPEEGDAASSDGPDAAPAPTPPATTAQGAEIEPGPRNLPADGQRSRPGAQAMRGPRLVTGADAIAKTVPPELLDAWSAATGKGRPELTRAWTRDPRSGRQWVVEADGMQWVVFSRGTRGIGVISLDQMRGGWDRRGPGGGRPSRTSRGGRRLD